MRAALVSFRLGHDDGVSIEAGKWRRALHVLGFDTITVAGGGKVDRYVKGLDFTDDESPDAPALDEALSDIDLVVVENLCSLPLKPVATGLTTALLRGRPAIFHHHDLPWQRERFAHITGWPATDPAWRHVVINAMTQGQLADRGIDAAVIPCAFDPPTSPGRRDAMRDALGILPAQLLQLQPTRAIERKGIPTAIALARRLGARLWITGPAEEGYVLDNEGLDILRRWPPGDWTITDAYAACDLVSFPSTWEGFGLPVVESAMHRRPLAVRRYPVLAEMAAHGFEWFDVDEPSVTEDIRTFLCDAGPDRTRRWFDHNERVARTHYSFEALVSRLRTVVDDVLR